MSLSWTPADANIELGGNIVHIRAPSKIQLRGGLNHLCHENGHNFIRGLGGLKPINNIVDVGGNIGATALMFTICFPEASVLAVEPMAINWEYLVYNTAPFPNIRCLKMAAGSKAGTVTMRMPSPEQRPDVIGNSGLFSIYGAGEDEEEVPMGTLDSIAARPVDLLKIDVEGAEAEVFAGAYKIIAQDRPLILVELRAANMQMAGHTIDDYDWYFEQVKYVMVGNYLGDLIMAPEELEIAAWLEANEYYKKEAG